MTADSEETIKRAYRKLALLVHPDKTIDKDNDYKEASKDILAKINNCNNLDRKDNTSFTFLQTAVGSGGPHSSARPASPGGSHSGRP